MNWATIIERKQTSVKLCYGQILVWPLMSSSHQRTKQGVFSFFPSRIFLSFAYLSFVKWLSVLKFRSQLIWNCTLTLNCAFVLVPLAFRPFWHDFVFCLKSVQGVPLGHFYAEMVEVKFEIFFSLTFSLIALSAIPFLFCWFPIVTWCSGFIDALIQIHVFDQLFYAHVRIVWIWMIVHSFSLLFVRVGRALCLLTWSYIAELLVCSVEVFDSSMVGRSSVCLCVLVSLSHLFALAHFGINSV